MDWSPSDSKTSLLEACKARGIEASRSRLRSELISLLIQHDKEQHESEAVLTAEEATKVAQSLSDEPEQTSPAPVGEPDVVYPQPDPSPPPKPAVRAAQPAPVVSKVMDYLLSVVDRVSFEQLIKECGPEARDEIKKLVSEHKVIQYRQHNKFWFQARYR